MPRVYRIIGDGPYAVQARLWLVAYEGEVNPREQQWGTVATFDTRAEAAVYVCEVQARHVALMEIGEPVRTAA